MEGAVFIWTSPAKATRQRTSASDRPLYKSSMCRDFDDARRRRFLLMEFQPAVVGSQPCVEECEHVCGSNRSADTLPGSLGGPRQEESVCRREQHDGRTPHDSRIVAFRIECNLQ